jgi:glycosyltransferase involved in cell wall biosynthesis
MRMLIAVPIFNEAKHLDDVLPRIMSYGHDVLAIDDGSTDATPALLTKYPTLQVITHAENRGYGQSLIDAFKFARCQRYDWALTMDCDQQHEPASIPRFYQAAMADDSDIISGSRYLPESSSPDQPPADRRSINLMITELLNSALDLGITDAFCGFKNHRVAALRKIHLDIPGYAFPMQFWVQAAYHKLRISELPIKLIYNDPSRHFGGLLDDPSVRLGHYLEVIGRQLSQVRLEAQKTVVKKECCSPCCCE